MKRAYGAALALLIPFVAAAQNATRGTTRGTCIAPGIDETLDLLSLIQKKEVLQKKNTTTSIAWPNW